MSDFKTTLLQACKSAKDVIITSHLGPDDDSVSSTLSTKYFLEQNTGKDIRIVYEGTRPRRWEGFEGFEKLEFVDDLNSVVKDIDVLVFLDGSELHRFSKEEIQTEATTFCIDHHPAEDPPFDHAVIEPERTSTAELLYDLLYEREADERAARYLLLGILGDTSNFRYVDKDKAGVFTTARELVEAGDINIEQYQRTYGGTHRKEFEVFATLMGNVVIQDDDKWPTYAYSFIDEEKAETFEDNDLSGGAHMFVSWIKGVQGVEWGFVLTPRSDGRVAGSFRSVSVNVRNIAEGLEVGGGHDRAAGARFDVTVEEAVAMVQQYVKENEPEMP